MSHADETSEIVGRPGCYPDHKNEHYCTQPAAHQGRCTCTCEYVLTEMSRDEWFRQFRPPRHRRLLRWVRGRGGKQP